MNAKLNKVGINWILTIKSGNTSYVITMDEFDMQHLEHIINDRQEG
jgi:hypothetical protein